MLNHSELLREDVRSALIRAGLTAQDRVVVGFSGGVDSQTLAHILATLHARGDGPAVLLVHVDHQLRPSSRDDAREARRIALALGLPLVVEQVDVSSWEDVAPYGIEASARSARYAALAREARSWGTEWVAVGHTRDDQVETVLFRLARGTSPDGLVGMREQSRRTVWLNPQRDEAVSLRVLRPLLRNSREQILAYAAQHRLVPIDDESNRDLRYRRNALRHEVVPALKRIVPGADSALLRCIDLLAEDVDYLTRLASDAFTRICLSAGDCIRIEREPLRALAPPLQRRVLALAIHRVGDERSFTLERLESLRAAVLSGAVSSTVEIGGRISAWVDYDLVMLGPADQLVSELRRARGFPMLEPGSEIPIRGSMRIPAGSRWQILCDVSRPLHGWSLRTRRPGDRVLVDGNRTRRLQDWLVNRKVPFYVRDSLPLLVRDDVIRWVAGISATPFEDRDSDLLARLIEQSENDRNHGEHVAKHQAP